METHAAGRTRVLVEMGMMIALAFVLGQIKLYQAPFGGSISLEMIPILAIAFRRGAKVGAATGLLYGMVNLFVDGMRYIVHPVQLLLDYPVPFMLVGLAGLARQRPVWGTVGAGMLRWCSHVVSGVVFFGAYAPEGMSPLVYSLVYNSAYMLPEIAISALVIWYLAVRTDVLPGRLVP